MLAILLMSDALSIVISVVSLFLGAILGQLVAMLAEKREKKIIQLQNAKSLAQIPSYRPEDDDILVIRQWNARDLLDDRKHKIVYDDTRKYDLISPVIKCPFISDPHEWEKMYAEELGKEDKRTGVVSYVTGISLDHKDTQKGNSLVIEVSSCDYIGHNVNSKYLAAHPQDWEQIKQVIDRGDLSTYFSCAMPGNVFINFIVINSQTNNFLAIRRSNQELNARNVWGITGFETMNDIEHAPYGSEEQNLRGIAYRGLLEELTLEPTEVSKLEISSMSFVKHLGLMVTALVRLDLNGPENDSQPDALTEGKLIQRILSRSKSGYEHSSFMWLPIKLTDMKQYIEQGNGYYQDVLPSSKNGRKDTWIGYTKLQMYEIWRNHESINIVL